MIAQPNNYQRQVPLPCIDGFLSQVSSAPVMSSPDLAEAHNQIASLKRRVRTLPHRLHKPHGHSKSKSCALVRVMRLLKFTFHVVPADAKCRPSVLHVLSGCLRESEDFFRIDDDTVAQLPAEQAARDLLDSPFLIPKHMI